MLGFEVIQNVIFPMEKMSKFPKNDSLKFVLGFLGMISLGFAILVAVGFYEVEVKDHQELSGTAVSVKP